MKKNIFTRLPAFLLAVLMVVSMLPVTALAADGVCDELPLCIEGGHDPDCCLYAAGEEGEEEEEEKEEAEPCTTEGCTYAAGHEGNHSNFVPCGTEGCEYETGHNGNCSNFVKCTKSEGCTYAENHGDNCSDYAAPEIPCTHTYGPWDATAEKAYFRTCGACGAVLEQEAPEEIGQLMASLQLNVLEDLSNLADLVKDYGVVPGIMTQDAADYLVKGMTPDTGDDKLTISANLGRAYVSRKGAAGTNDYNNIQIWGEVTGLAGVQLNSFVVNFYAEDGTTLVASTSLVPQFECEGSLSWHLRIDGHDDKDNWTYSWVGGGPSPSRAPAKASFVINGSPAGTIDIEYDNEAFTACDTWAEWFVAQVDRTYYYSLADAIENANGAEINLLTNTTENNITVAADQTAVINLNYKKVTGNFIIKGNATIKDGTIECVAATTNAVEIPKDGSSPYLVLENVNVSSAQHAVRIKAGEAKITGGTYTAGYHGIGVSGSSVAEIAADSISGNLSSASTGDSGVSVACYKDSTSGLSPTVTIKGGKIEGISQNPYGNLGFFEAGGNLTIEHAEIEKMLSFSPTTIKGGKFGSVALNNDGHTISGGSFKTKPDEAWIAEGYAIKTDAAEEAYQYSVVKAAASITSGGTTKYYATLAEAVAAAKDDDTITLLGNVTEEATIAIAKKLTVAIGAHTITGPASAALFNVSGALTITGTRTGTISAATALTVSGEDWAVTKPEDMEITVPEPYFWEGDTTLTNWYGDGSASEFIITTEAELRDFAEKVNEGITFDGKVVKLGNDIALTEPFGGIGVYNQNDASKAFQGTFDGQSNTISNVTFTGAEYRGLFNQLYEATVQNLTVDCVGFKGASGSYGGAAIAGFANNSTISGCVATGFISGTHNVAGIVVRIRNSTIRGCTNKANLSSSYTKIGGIAALSQNSTSGCLIEGCVNNGALVSNGGGGDGVGGIIGWIGSRSDSGAPADEGQRVTIKNCQNNGSISGGELMGQIVGKAFSYWSIEGTNKGLKNMLAVGYGTISGLKYATVEGNEATYISDSSLEAGKTYLVTALNATPAITLSARETITFDTTLAGIDDTGIEPTGKVIKTVDGKKITYTAAVAMEDTDLYMSLEKAVGEAAANDTVTLLGDTTENISLDKSITLDLNGNVLTGTVTVSADTVALTVQNPKEDASGFALASPAAKEGYTLGWKNGETAMTVSTVTAAGTYAIHWTPNQYTIAFNANGGEGTMTSISATYGQNATIPANTFTKTGYTVTGWNTQADGKGDSYAAGATNVLNLTAENGGVATLYAQWTANTYTVVFDANGGTGSNSTDTVTYDVTFKLPAIGKGEGKVDFTAPSEDLNFIGWNTQSNGKGVTYAPGAAVSNLTDVNGGNYTLYAMWSAAQITPPEITLGEVTTYNSSEQPLTVNTPSGYRAELTYYKAGTDEAVDPVDAGVYDLKVDLYPEAAAKARARATAAPAFSYFFPKALTITKAPLYAAYEGETIYAGTKPALKIAISGFQGGDTAANNPGGFQAPAFKTAAPSTIGKHYMELGGGNPGSNYYFVYENGYLTIKEKVVYVYSGETLLQTGELAWLVPMLAFCGVAVMAAGAWIALKKKNYGR